MDMVTDMVGIVIACKALMTTALRGLRVAVGLAALAVAPAFAFDYARYQVTDLDDVLTQPRPKTGLGLHRAEALRLEVKLVSYEETCNVEAIAPTMRMLNFSKEMIDGVQASRCIKVRSAQGRETLVFVQDVVRAFLPAEVPLGGTVTLYAVHLFTTSTGPGLLVNEFEAKKPKGADAAAMTPGCGCGAADFHPGVDYTSEKAGMPVAAVDDGVVIRVEQDDQAAVEFFNIGRCGRYVVLKHSYPNGHVVFTRYAQLGRIVGANGRPIVAGATIRKNDKIGEVGPTKVLHFEVRPVAAGTTQTDAAWQARYGTESSMEWSRYDAVDPQTFDADIFAGRSSKSGAGR
jgi:murein DD-endopeptidase MepM/ murein hydrolase activator NlpD